MLQQICNLPQYGISAEEVPLRFIDAHRYAPDIVRSQPRTASLLSGNSVLRAGFILKSEADSAAGRSLFSSVAGFCSGVICNPS